MKKCLQMKIKKYKYLARINWTIFETIAPAQPSPIKPIYFFVNRFCKAYITIADEKVPANENKKM